MKKILFGLLFICSIARAQTDDSTRYLRYPTQYGMRMPRGWFDSVLHLPYGDSARFRSSKNGAVMMHTSGDVVKWYNNKWNLLGGGTSQNFANTDLTLTGNRSHSFGTNEMRFNFTGLGLLGDGYVAFNQDNIPGIVIQGDDDYIGGTIKFRSLANPSATTTISNFYGTIQMRSRVGVNQGFADIGDEQTWIGVDKGVAGLVKEIGFTRAAYKGINLRDGIDTTGAFYDNDYSINGIANHGDRWIPDAGWVKDRIPNDFTYQVEETDCHDTTFVNSAGVTIGNYEIKTLPQYVGLRVRVNTSGLQLSEDPRWGSSWYYEWNKTTGVLRIYTGGTCAESFIPGQLRLIQGY